MIFFKLLQLSYYNIIRFHYTLLQIHAFFCFTEVCYAKNIFASKIPIVSKNVLISNEIIDIKYVNC